MDIEDPIHSDIVTRIRYLGFTCIRCGQCCTEREEGEALVMVSPGEISAIREMTGLSREEIASPFPGTVIIAGKEVTFEWALHRDGSRCRFYQDWHCSIYQKRPFICRTYPFVLSNNELATPSPCHGIGHPISQEEASLLAADLQNRAAAEEREEAKIAYYLQFIHQTPGSRLVLDGEGITSIHG